MKKTLIIIGSLILILGIIGLITKGYSYTTEEELFHIGPWETTSKTAKTIIIPRPLTGAVAVFGLILVLFGLRNKNHKKK